MRAKKTREQKDKINKRRHEIYLEKLQSQKRVCLGCGIEYTPTDGKQKYCETKCRTISDSKKFRTKAPFIQKACEKCGIEFQTNLKLQKFCSRKCQTSTLRKEKQAKIAMVKLENWKANPLVCKQCGCEFIRTDARQIYCSRKCSYKFNDEHRNRELEAKRNNKRYHTMMNSGGYDRSISVKELVKRNGLKCAICDKNTDMKDFYFKNGAFVAGEDYPSVDHIFPVSKGGTHTWDNIQLAHRRCNTLKKDKISYKTQSGQMKLSV